MAKGGTDGVRSTHLQQLNQQIFSSFFLFGKYRYTRLGVDVRLEIWRDALHSKYFCLSRTKTEYMECNFSKSTNKDEGFVRLYGKEMPKSVQ